MHPESFISPATAQNRKTTMLQYSFGLLLTFSIACLVDSPAGAGDAPPPVLIAVHERVTGTIHDALFGQFVELLEAPTKPDQEHGAEAAFDPATGQLRPDVLEALRGMYLPVLRYPGGVLIEYPTFRWTQLIEGPADGDELDERRFLFGLHEFLDLCAQLDAEPLLTLKLVDMVRESIPPAEVVAMAEAMVAYVNAPADAELEPRLRRWVDLRIANGRREPWNVRKWQIGNEFIWVGVKWLKKERGMNPQEIGRAYVDAVVKVHDAIRAVDPSLELLVEIDMEQPKIEVPVAEALAERLGSTIHHMTHHRYTSWGITKALYRGEERSASEVDARAFWYAAVSAPEVDARGLAVFAPPMLETANRLGYPLAVTEWNWNSWWQVKKDPAAPPPPDDLWTKGVAAGSILHGLMNAPGDISLATQSMLVGTSWDIRAIDARQHPARLHPSGQITSLYGHHHGRDRLAWSTEKPLPTYDQPWKLSLLKPQPAVSFIDLVVTRNDRGVYLHVINRDYDNPRTLLVDTSKVLNPNTKAAVVYRLVENPAFSSEGGEAVALSQEIPVTRETNRQWEFTLPPASIQVIFIEATP